MTDAPENWRERWLGAIKAVGYELRPFTLPTKDDLAKAARATKMNAEQLWTEARRLAPEIVQVIKSLNPLRALMVLTWVCGWAGFIWLEFGAVYFIVSAMVMIFVNLGEREEGEWSAYSVFNAGCRALLGTINAEQFEREIMRQNPAAPAHDDVIVDHNHNNNRNNNNAINAQQEDDFVWVEPPGMRGIAAAAAADAAAADAYDNDAGGYDSSGDEVENDANNNAVGGVAGGGRGGGRKVSGKRARRGFEERRERQEERRLALEALGHEEWN